MAAVVLEAAGALQQLQGGFSQGGAAIKPVQLGGGEIAHHLQTFERAGVAAAVAQPEHAEGLLKGLHQAAITQVVGAHKAIAVAQEHPDTSAHAEGGADAGDGVLLSQDAEVVGALQENLN